MLDDLDQNLVSRLPHQERTAQNNLQNAQRKYNATIAELGKIPHPDGSLQLQQAGAEVRRLNRESADATRRLMDYVIRGKMPDGY